MERHPCCIHLRKHITENHLYEDEEEGDGADERRVTPVLSFESIYERSAESDVAVLDAKPVRILRQNSSTTTTAKGKKKKKEKEDEVVAASTSSRPVRSSPRGQVTATSSAGGRSLSPPVLVVASIAAEGS